MHSKAGMWHHVGSTMKIVRNTLFLLAMNDREEEKEDYALFYWSQR